jgi:hypothetical protein
VKALKPFSSYFCLAHRLNNILRQGFYQTKRKKQDKSLGLSLDPNVNVGSSSDESEDSEGEDMANILATTTDQLSQEARIVLKTIADCKSLVRYVKKVIELSYPGRLPVDNSRFRTD